MIYDGFVDAIGNTPLIKLRAASARTAKFRCSPPIPISRPAEPGVAVASIVIRFAARAAWSTAAASRSEATKVPRTV